MLKSSIQNKGMKNKIKFMMKGEGYKNGLGNKGCNWYKERERGKIKKER